MTHPAILTWIT